MNRGIPWAGFLTALSVFVFVPSGAWAQHSEVHQVEHLEPQNVGRFEPVNSPDLKQVEQLIIQKTNEFREKEGREKLKVNDKLAKEATGFATYMARTDRYGHYAESKGPAKRAEEANYEYCVIAENIAYDFKTKGFETEKLAESLMTGWKNSPPHRRNMLKRSVREIGVAVAQSQKTGVFYAVQDFGRPKSAMIEFRLTNKTDVTLNYALGDRQYELPPGYSRTHEMCQPSKLRWQPSLKSNTESKPREIEPQKGATYQVETQNDQVLIKRASSDKSSGSQ